MRRAPFVAGVTVLGLVGIMAFHSQNPISPVLATPKPPPAAKSPAASSSTTTPSTSGQPGPTSTSTSRTTVPPATVTRSATGPTEQYGYGTLAVKVTVIGTKITDLSTPGHYEHAQYSQQLAAQVIPMLRSEVLQAQSANINGISGATYTSEAYATSLQAALDQLHVP
jgi:uncharacterized protein with FMN-binding domain